MTPPPSDTKNSQLNLDFEKSPAVLSVLGDGLGQGVFTVDRQARFVGWSRAAERITGYSLEDVKGQTCHMFEGVECKGFNGLSQLLGSSSSETTGMEDLECRAYSKTSQELHLLGSVRLLRNGSGNVYGAIGAFTEITAILKAKAVQPRTLSSEGLGGLVGTSPAMEEIFRRIRLAADSDVTTLITGDSGTGKELAARAIHSLSDRRDSPFIAINCSAIPETLLESELFGHVKGSFTGATRDRCGVFETANGGTLFLDEIGDISPLLQLKLLRVLQEREIRRVGDERTIPVDVRVVTATNCDLMERIADGLVREDFYYRIRVFDVRMPALRERASDIPLLAQHFVEEIAQTRGKLARGIARDALETLVRYPWPGNVRELRNALEHAMVVQLGDHVGLLDLPEEVRRGARVPPNGRENHSFTPNQEAERLRILQALETNVWHRTRTAQSLGVSRVTLWKKIRRYQLEK